MATHAKRRKMISPPALIAWSFVITIAVGTLLLKLPISTYAPISWTDAFFTATSATTVTGLGVFDIHATLTSFGEIVLLVLIQIGGVGFMAFAVALLLILGRKVGMKNRMFIQESFNYQSIGGTLKFLREIVLFVFLAEGIAFIALSIFWVGLGQNYLKPFPCAPKGTLSEGRGLSQVNSEGFALPYFYELYRN